MLEDHKIAAFLITKAANTSIKVAFLEALGKRVDSPHLKSEFRYAEKDEIAALPGDWFTFAVVRNPYDRMVSLWADKCRDRHHPLFIRRGIGPFKDFNDFAKALCGRKDFDIHWVSQHETIGEVPDFVARHENLKGDWQIIQSRCLKHGLILPLLPVENESVHGDWRGYYTPETRKMVYARYRQDFEAFDYAA